MRTGSLRLCALAMATVCVFAFTSASMGSLDVWVVQEHSGVPVGGANVHIFRLGAPGLAADLECDREGRCQAPEMPAGSYRIEVSKTGYVSAVLSVDGPLGRRFVVPLVREGVITGQVTHPQGKALGDALVLPMVKPAEGSAPVPHQTGAPLMGRVDSRGRYRLYNLPPGEYAVALSYSDPLSETSLAVRFYPNDEAPRIFVVSGGEEYTGVDFFVDPLPSCTLSGRVQSPVEGSSVQLSLAPVNQPALVISRARADSDGRFHFEGIPVGSYDLLAVGEVRRAGEVPAAADLPLRLYGRTRLEASPPDTGDISVSLSQGRMASFALHPMDGFNRVEGCPSAARLTLKPLEDWGRDCGAEVDLRSGQEQSVHNLAPGRYAVALSGLGDQCYLAGPSIVDLRARNEPGPILLEMTAAASISGRLSGLGDSNPTEFVVVLTPRAYSGATPSQIAVPGADSKFAFTALRPGKYRLTARTATANPGAGPALGPAGPLEIELRGGAVTEVDLPVALAGAGP